MNPTYVVHYVCAYTPNGMLCSLCMMLEAGWEVLGPQSCDSITHVCVCVRALGAFVYCTLNCRPTRLIEFQLCDSALLIGQHMAGARLAPWPSLRSACVFIHSRMLIDTDFSSAVLLSFFPHDLHLAMWSGGAPFSVIHLCVRLESHYTRNVM